MTPKQLFDCDDWESKRQHSYNILDGYKNDLTLEDYTIIRQTIGNNAIEDVFLDVQDIQDMVDVVSGKKTSHELIQSYKQSWGVA